MKIVDLVSRPVPPVPWDEGDNIPWNNPEFSERMLKEHLSQEHDSASRRFEKIEKQVEWIHNILLSGQPTKILDLGCGPGLYTNRLAKLGHDCVGIDYSPASIAHAVENANKERLRCRYINQDIRMAQHASEFGLVMLIFGEFNVFRTVDARIVLGRVHLALSNNGLLLLEPHTFDAIKRIGESGTSWYSAEKGLFSQKPHIYFEENFWDSDGYTATTRYFVFDIATGEVTPFAKSLMAYTEEQYISILEKGNFEDIEFFPSLTGEEDESQRDFVAIVARKKVKDK